MDKVKIIEMVVKAKLALERSDTYDARVCLENLLNKLCNDSSTSKPKIQRSHKTGCMIEMDPEYYGPCTCGRDNGYDDNDHDY